MSEFAAEVVGTLVLILLGNGVVANVVLSLPPAGRWPYLPLW
jgi:glycerol uptake facilitator-like aquaporin